MSHTCKLCVRSFSSEWMLEKHNSYFHRVDVCRYKCKSCDKTFHHESELKTHAKTHSKGPFRCGVCGERFTSLQLMKKHSSCWPCECTVCGKGFDREHQLETHSHVHTGEKPFKCSKCGDGFATEEQLTEHIDNHKSAALQCSQCYALFSDVKALKKHEHEHWKPFLQTLVNCAWCGEELQSRFLDKHKRAHKTQKSYTCSVCQEEFKDVQLLKHHISFHTEEESFVCPICDHLFSEVGLLKDHICISEDDSSDSISEKSEESNQLSDQENDEDATKDKHPQENTETSHAKTPEVQSYFHAANSTHICPTCFEKFTDISDFNLHMESCREDLPYTCSVCGHGFPTTDLLEDHTDAKRCPICCESFACAIKLKVHSYTHPEKGSYKCPYCDKMFDSRVRIMKHAFTHKPHKCPVCVAEFGTLVQLNRHVCRAKLEKKKEVDEGSKSQKEQTDNWKAPGSFQCTICKMQFKFRIAFQSHMQGHAKETLNKCSLCGDHVSEKKMGSHIIACTEARKRLSKRHKPLENTSNSSQHAKEQIINEQSKPVETPNVKKSTKSSNRTRVCSKCGDTFTDAKALRLHMYDHIYKTCNLCGMAFTLEKLQQHSPICQGKKVRTTIITRNHQKPTINSKDDIYKCSVCEMKFTKQVLLKEHSYVHKCYVRLENCLSQQKQKECVGSKENKSGKIDQDNEEESLSSGQNEECVLSTEDKSDKIYQDEKDESPSLTQDKECVGSTEDKSGKTDQDEENEALPLTQDKECVGLKEEKSDKIDQDKEDGTPSITQGKECVGSEIEKSHKIDQNEEDELPSLGQDKECVGSEEEKSDNIDQDEEHELPSLTTDKECVGLKEEKSDKIDQYKEGGTPSITQNKECVGLEEEKSDKIDQDKDCGTPSITQGKECVGSEIEKSDKIDQDEEDELPLLTEDKECVGSEEEKSDKIDQDKEAGTPSLTLDKQCVGSEEEKSGKTDQEEKDESPSLTQNKECVGLKEEKSDKIDQDKEGETPSLTQDKECVPSKEDESDKIGQDKEDESPSLTQEKECVGSKEKESDKELPPPTQDKLSVEIKNEKSDDIVVDKTVELSPPTRDKETTTSKAKTPNCSVCGETFDNLLRLRIHANIHKYESCSLCQKVFIKHKLQAHFIACAAECFTSSENVQNLSSKHHQNMEDGNASRENKSTEHPPALSRNKRSSNRKIYVCPVCDMKFTDLDELEKHSYVHKCCVKLRNCFPDCTSRVSDRATMVRGPPVGKTHRCLDCGKGFQEVSELKVHANVHKLKPCSLCGKLFTCKDILQHFLDCARAGRPYKNYPARSRKAKRVNNHENLSAFARVDTPMDSSLSNHVPSSPEKSAATNPLGKEQPIDKSNLGSHNLAPTGDKEHSCSVGKMSISDPQDHEEHNHIHKEKAAHGSGHSKKRSIDNNSDLPSPDLTETEKKPDLTQTEKKPLICTCVKRRKTSYISCRKCVRGFTDPEDLTDHLNKHSIWECYS